MKSWRAYSPHGAPQKSQVAILAAWRGAKVDSCSWRVEVRCFDTVCATIVGAGGP
jgi:hypothetical protein